MAKSKLVKANQRGRRRGWIFPYFVYKRMLGKQTEKNNTIDRRKV